MVKVTENQKKSYIKSLDLYILSHGGVGSNYLISYLQNKKLSVMTNIILYQNTCHYSYKLVPDKKTIYLYGDIINSIISQYKRNVLHINATKIHELRDYNHENLVYFLKKYPDDPIGIKKQYYSLINSKNTISIKYPYDKDELKKAFKILNLKVELLNDIKIKNRKTVFNKEKNKEYVHKNPILQKIIQAYIDFDY